MPLASGSKKAKLKDKGKAAKKKGQKTSVAPSESCLSPAISPTLDPQLQQQAVLDPESLPPLPDSVQLSPESAEINLAAGRSPSPKKDLLTSSFHSAYVEDEGTEQEEAVEPRPEMVPQSTDPAPDKPAEDSSDPQEEHHPFEEAENVLDELEKELHTADAPTDVAAEQKPESPEETILEDADSSGPALPPPPAPKPLPSPSPTNANSTRSPGPEHQLAHRGSSSVAGYKSPVYKYASPPMHTYSPYMMNAHPHMMHPGSSVHPSSASFATAYHPPNMEHASMGSPYGYGKRSGSIATGARDYYHAGMDPPRTNGNANGHRELDDGPLEDDSHDPVHLLTRIEKVMPDLSRLLHSFKDTRGKLTAREAEARQLEAQHEQALMHKDFYIEALQAQMKKSATETAEELSKLRNTINELRLELGNLQEKLKDMEENLTTSQNERDELSQARTELEGEIENLQTTIRELQVAHERATEGQKEHERAELATQKEELTSLFEEIRAEDEKAANDKYNIRENELLDEQESMKSAWDQEKQQMEEAGSILQTEHEAAMNDKQTELDGKTQELNDAQLQLERTMEQLEARKSELESQKNELLSKQGELDSKITELEAKHVELETTRAEVTTKQSKIEEKHKELDEIRQKHAVELEQLTDSHRGELDNLQETHSNERQGDRDLHAVELSGLKDTHEGQLATALKEAEEKLQALLVQVQEKEKNWESHRLSLERQLVEKVDELATLEREREALERNDIARERQLQTAVDEMRRTIDNMESDREKLRKTLQSLGEATDLKASKGDPFFVESFGQLSRLILDLSREQFAYLPIDPPKDILEKIPPEMPSFLDNTPASRELRSAYIQHVISKTLTYRIFQPFLFTLGRRYDKADTFFHVLSMDIRRKSVRREAFWRQQTLKAAYTTSDAKQSINVVAAVIVDEIVDHIKHFADPNQLDALLSGIRRIVKLAAETWRHARVERELVLATMPASESDDVLNAEWDEYTGGRSVDGRENDNTNNTGASARHVLLRMFPRIYREAAHEDFADDKEKFNDCVYAAGVVLFSDSPSVLARRDELARKATESPSGSNGAGGEGSRAASRNSTRKSPVSVAA